MGRSDRAEQLQTDDARASRREQFATQHCLELFFDSVDLSIAVFR